jgi:hypothetical protein
MAAGERETERGYGLNLAKQKCPAIAGHFVFSGEVCG